MDGKQTAFPPVPCPGKAWQGGLCFLLIASCLSQPKPSLFLSPFYGLNRRRRWARPLKRNDDPNSNPVERLSDGSGGRQGLPFCHIKLDDVHWTDMALWMDGRWMGLWGRAATPPLRELRVFFDLNELKQMESLIASWPPPPDSRIDISHTKTSQSSLSLSLSRLYAERGLGSIKRAKVRGFIRDNHPL
ncbi:hypothetical protein CH063_10830 [Colletotrichum higginsianum]|uniref:Uncharacterized protein n=1 Tax=Colletotrichum higginsianum (strain IMI 349063) TaxID=759273 RepID=H1VIZ7_COLHI|nr:hypothetical protein CH063_10830 [Colletotrichum higginsianum]